MKNHIWDTMARSKMINHTHESTETVDFGKTDSKGRRIGAMIVRDNETYALMTEAEIKTSFCFSYIEPGLWFTYHIQTTRNGSRYGACQPTHYFATVEERDVAIHAHLARSMKAAAKKAA